MSGIIRTTRDRTGDEHVARGALTSHRSSPGAAPRGRASVRPRTHRVAGTTGGASDEDGFTLVELLVVVLVLAALVGIAVPTFVGQRESAWGAAVSSELRSAAIALESSRAQNAIYSEDAFGSDAGWGFVPSSSVELRYDISIDDYCMIAWFTSDSDSDGPSDVLGDAAAASSTLWGAKPSGIVEGVLPNFCA